MSYDAERTASGRDAERKRAEREASREVPRSPDDTREVPLSDSDSDSDSKSEKDAREARSSTSSQKSREPEQAPPGLDPVAWTRWLEYRKAIGKPVKPVSILAAQRKLAAHGASQAAVVEHTIANGWQGLFAPKDVPKPNGRAESPRQLKDAFEVANGRR